MSVTWDAVLVRATAQALHERFAAARSRAIYFDGPARAAYVFFRESTLELRLHPNDGRILVRAASDPFTGSYTLPGQLLGVEAPDDERFLNFRFRRRRGRVRAVVFVVELMSNQWNALLLEGLDGLVRHVLKPRVGGTRPLVPGKRYEPPPPSDREGVDGRMPAERWSELTSAMSATVARKWLVRHVAWTSSLNAPALVPEALESTGEGPRGLALWRRLANSDEDAAWCLTTASGPQPYPQRLPHLPAELRADLFDAFDADDATTDRPEGRVSVPSPLRSRLDDAILRAQRALHALQVELEKTPDPEALRHEADLILARLGDIVPGSARLETRGFDGTPRSIELEPGIQPYENADRRYRRAGKAARALRDLPERIQDARNALERLEGLVARVESGQAGPAEVSAALPEPAAGSGRETHGRRGSRAADRARPYRSYRSSGGLEIRVGRGAKFNDQLTFHHSSPNDVWLHARDQAGAHVVLRWDRDGKPPARDLEEAAVLAALNSAARHAGVVPVDWTRRKYVRKSRRAPPGRVVVERVKTVFVEPDPALPDRLLHVGPTGAT